MKTSRISNMNFINKSNKRITKYFHIITITAYFILRSIQSNIVEGFTAKLIPIHYQITTPSNKQSSSHTNQQSTDTTESKDESEHTEILNGNDVIVIDGLPFITGASKSLHTVIHKSKENEDDKYSKSENISTKNKVTIRSSLPTLLKLSRPKNFPISILLHILSIHLVLSNLPQTLNRSYCLILLSAILHPSLLLTISCILLLSATSMIINDYYDARNGVDSISNHYHPLSSGDIPLPLVKKFLSYLYSLLLVGIVALPGIYTRISAIIGTMLTYAYTEHLKPITWIKNVVCAGLIGISPLASGLATMHVYSTSNIKIIMPLLRMVCILCIGVLSREITMDIVDYQGDKVSNILTIPVKYGKRFAANVCLMLSSLNSLVIVIPPMLRLVSIVRNGGVILPRMIQFGIACIAAGILWNDSYRVKVTEGLDDDVSNNAVNHASVAILLVLASFI